MGRPGYTDLGLETSEVYGCGNGMPHLYIPLAHHDLSCVCKLHQLV